MASANIPSECGEDNLFALQLELSAQGVKADLDTCTAWPRLRVYGEAEINPRLAEFDNSVVAVSYDGEWWFSWPWAEKISPVTDVKAAAELIIRTVGKREGEDYGNDGTCAGTGKAS